MRLYSGVLSFAFLLLGVAGCTRTEVVPVASAGDVLRDTIVVVGEGEAKGAPDIAKLQLGVEARAQDAKVAVDAANARMAAVVEALKSVGISAEDLQTSEFNIHSEHMDPGYPIPLDTVEAAPDAAAPVAPATKAEVSASRVAPDGVTVSPPTPAPRQPRLVYRASNMLHVTLRNLDQLGEVLSRAVVAGANQAWGVSFTLEDDAPLVEKARAESMADARTQATALAHLAGVRLGKVVAISDAVIGGPGPVLQMAAYARDESAGGVPFERGQVTVHRRVRVVFAIEPAAAQ